MQHEFQTRVFYEDTDLGGVVYYANYLKFIERARSDWVEQVGVDQNIMRDQGLAFVVRRVEADYKRPAKLNDRLVVRSLIERSGRLEMCFNQAVWLDQTCLFEAKVWVVTIAQSGRPKPLPDEIATLLVQKSA